MRIRGVIPKRIVVRENNVKGILSYDTGNDYPQRVKDIVNDSGRASSCIDKFALFIEGQGFNVESLNDVIANNKGETLFDILVGVAKSYATFSGFCTHLNVDANGKYTSIKNVDFESARLGTPDDAEYVDKIAIYHNWDRRSSIRIMRKDIVKYFPFTPNAEAIKLQVAAEGGYDQYKGQMFYYSNLGPAKYPLASLDAVLEDCVTDAQIKTFKYNRVTTDFMASHMLVSKGKVEGDNEDVSLRDQLMAFQGAENSNKIFLVEVEYDEEIPEIKPFENVNNDKLFEYTEWSVHENIRKKLLIPPVLVGDLIAGKLGTSEEIYDAYALYNSLTFKHRNIVTRELRKILLNWKDDLGTDFTIKPNEIDLGEKDKLAKKEGTQNDD